MLRAVVIGLVALALGVSPAAAKGRLFYEDAPLHLVITAPFLALVRAAPTSPKPYPATLAVSDGAGPAQSFPIELTARGHYRRTSGSCRFPPLIRKTDVLSDREGGLRTRS